MVQFPCFNHREGQQKQIVSTQNNSISKIIPQVNKTKNLKDDDHPLANEVRTDLFEIPVFFNSKKIEEKEKKKEHSKEDVSIIYNI